MDNYPQDCEQARLFSASEEGLRVPLNHSIEKAHRPQREEIDGSVQYNGSLVQDIPERLETLWGKHKIYSNADRTPPSLPHNSQLTRTFGISPPGLHC